MNDSPTYLVTPDARLSYPNLFEPRAANEGADPRYSCVLIFPAEVPQDAFKKALLAAGEEKFPDFVTLLKAGKIKTPFKACDQNPENAAFTAHPGGWYMNAASKNAPGVVDQKVQDVLDKQLVFGGLLVRAALNAYAWQHPTGGRGVSFGLQHVQIVRDDGTRYDNRRTAAQSFEPVAESNPGEAANSSTMADETDAVAAGW